MLRPKDVAVLLSRSDAGENVADLTGHVVPGSDAATSCNDYAVLQWLTARAADAGVWTPRILAIGEDPRPYALIQRAHGTLASVHPHVTEKAATWFGQLGAASVLTHYDNNLVVDADEITVLDWVSPWPEPGFTRS